MRTDNSGTENEMITLIPLRNDEEKHVPSARQLRVSPKKLCQPAHANKKVRLSA